MLPSPNHQWNHHVVTSGVGEEPAQGGPQTSVWILASVQTPNVLIAFGGSTVHCHQHSCSRTTDPHTALGCRGSQMTTVSGGYTGLSPQDVPQQRSSSSSLSLHLSLRYSLASFWEGHMLPQLFYFIKNK